MVSIEETIKDIASKCLPTYSYVFDNWYDADARLEHLTYPAILCVMPTSGQTTIKNGRVYDTEYIAVALLDEVPRGAEGEDHELVYSRMKEAGAGLIRAINGTGIFAPIERVDYSIICEKLSTIVSGVMYSLTLTQRVGGC